MKKAIYSLLLGHLLFWVSTPAVFAQDAIAPVAKGVATVIKGGTNALAKNAIKRMLPRIITGEIGVTYAASTVMAGYPAKDIININSFSLPATWSTHLEIGPGAVKTSPLSIEQMTNLLVKPDAQFLTDMGLPEQEMFFLKGYPAATVEWPIVLSPGQQMQALDFYRRIIQESSTHGQIIGIDGWAKKMSAVTNLGLFGEGIDADAILNAAKTQREGSPLCGITDVIAVRALLNLKMYDYVQILANYRLATGKLSPEWKEIQKYMNQAGLPLDIPKNKIAPANTRPTLANSPTAIQWLRYYNPYNVFHTDPSAATTTDWLDLRKAIDKNRSTAHVQKQVVGKLDPKGPAPITLTTEQQPVMGSTASQPKPKEQAEREAREKYTPEQLQDIAHQQERLISRINDGYLQARYTLKSGEEFYPYGQAMARAKATGNNHILSMLEKCDGLTSSFYYSNDPARRLGLRGLDSDAEVIAQIAEYVQETTGLMFQGYSWGPKPSVDIRVPAQYHASEFEETLERFLRNAKK